MIITNKNAIKQALANARLESLIPPDDVMELISKSLYGEKIDTRDIISLLNSTCN